jgi:hypothetical protein
VCGGVGGSGGLTKVRSLTRSGIGGVAARLTYGRRATIRDAARDMMIDRVTPAVGCGRSVSLGRPRSPSEVVGGGAVSLGRPRSPSEVVGGGAD